MSEFKLLAIRPLDGCDKKFTKVLKENIIFKFYKNYDFLNQEGNDAKGKEEVVFIRHNYGVPDQFYSSDALSINISAVVGKNGCGKSSLVEFLYYAIYCLGTSIKLGDTNFSLLNSYSEIVRLQMTALEDEKISREAYLKTFQTDLELLVSEIGRDFTNEHIKAKIFQIVETEERITKLSQQIKHKTELEEIEQREHARILKEFCGSIYYEIDDQYYELKIDPNSPKNSPNNEGSNIEIFNVFSQNDMHLTSLNVKELNKPFFYTIAMNHSHYSLNNVEMGNWINTLFHKNDGYKTPIVINPMRDKGDFEIVHEGYLAKQRLIVNIISHEILNNSSSFHFSDRLTLKEVKFGFRKQKAGRRIINIEDDSFVSIGGRKGITLFTGLFNKKLVDGTQKLIESTQEHKLEIINYAVNKLEKLLGIYGEYDLKDWQDDGKIEALIDRLNEDSSHVMFKVNQAINYLINNIKGKEDFISLLDDSGRISSKNLLKWMNVTEVEKISEFIPPSLFSVDFVLENENSINKKDILFGTLSSGEQQFIHSMQAVIYHLINLESIHKSSVNRLRYAAVNIIFDEIELYFHPDLQRRFISSLLKNIESLNLGRSDNGIKALNIQFLTHSPFILSDIPTQNVLKLKEGAPEDNETKTFGANIHELLADSFFMDSTTGEIALQKIDEIVKFYQEVRNATSTHQIAQLQEKFRTNKNMFEFVTDNIGEDVIRGMLKSYLNFIKEDLNVETIEYNNEKN